MFPHQARGGRSRRAGDSVGRRVQKTDLGYRLERIAIAIGVLGLKSWRGEGSKILSGNCVLGQSKLSF
jgi:hypothetical protein